MWMRLVHRQMCELHGPFAWFVAVLCELNDGPNILTGRFRGFVLNTFFIFV